MAILMNLRPWRVALSLMVLALTGCVRTPPAGVTSVAAKATASDLSTIRGANYRGAGATNTTDYWLHYNASETERDLTYAGRLKLNQLRVFVNYASWRADKAAFRKNLVDLARACDRHRIGLMITVGDTQTFINDDGAINRGHNPLEPAQFGVPIVIGPHYANFRTITEDLLAHDALRIATKENLAATLIELLRDSAAATAMGERARQVFNQQAGCVDALRELLPPITIPERRI